MSDAAKLAAVEKYIENRTSKNNDVCLSLIDDDFVFDHFKDGRIQGKAAFGEYLNTHEPPSGKSETPVVEGDKVKIVGYVRKMMMDWKYFLEFEFNAENMITGIKIYR
eukprot:Rhum_TRINITY_DN20852_c0_g1::Rhum_TRINITY_DN20852_c0_g1_i1::g.172370::m.172370